jgi:hypothetical protein
MKSRFVKVCLFLIVLLLVLTTCKPLFRPNIARAAGTVHYKVVELPGSILSGGGETEAMLNALGNDGWELVTVVPGGGAGMAILKK